MTTPRRGPSRARAAAPAGRRRSGAPATPPCARADQLWAYLDGELPAARARAVARHMSTCATCGTRARRLRAMLETCRAAGCRKLPADVRARARSRVAALLAGAGKNR